MHRDRDVHCVIVCIAIIFLNHLYIDRLFCDMVKHSLLRKEQQLYIHVWIYKNRVNLNTAILPLFQENKQLLTYLVFSSAATVRLPTFNSRYA